jgi:uncharacterized membrane protein
MTTDTNKRSLIKTISWRITGSGATFFVAYLISDNFNISSTIALLQLVTNTILYYIHERIWNKINWGKKINTQL